MQGPAEVRDSWHSRSQCKAGRERRSERGSEHSQCLAQPSPAQPSSAHTILHTSHGSHDSGGPWIPHIPALCSALLCWKRAVLRPSIPTKGQPNNPSGHPPCLCLKEAVFKSLHTSRLCAERGMPQATGTSHMARALTVVHMLCGASVCVCVRTCPAKPKD